MVRELMGREVFTRMVEALGVDNAELRAGVVASQVVGLLMARHVVSIESLASLPADALATAIAPKLQSYLTGPLAPTEVKGGDRGAERTSQRRQWFEFTYSYIGI